MQSRKYLDAHHHLWDLSQIHYPWLMAKGSERFFGQPDPIRKNYLPDDYQGDHQGRVEASIHIQVGATPEHNLKETQFIDELAKNGAPVVAAIAAVDVTAADIDDQLDMQNQFTIVKGVRHMIGKSPTENHQLPEFVGSQWLPGLHAIANRKLTFDLQFTEEQYQDVFNTFSKVPELKVAICHFASPWDQSAEGFHRWQKAMEQFATLPNCYMKLSGFSMFTHSFNLDNFIKYCQAAIDIFGIERCMLGSNFPVDKLHMNFGELLAAWDSLLEEYSPSEAQKLSKDNAINFYGLYR